MRVHGVRWVHAPLPEVPEHAVEALGGGRQGVDGGGGAPGEVGVALGAERRAGLCHHRVVLQVAGDGLSAPGEWVGG